MPDYNLRDLTVSKKKVNKSPISFLPLTICAIIIFLLFSSAVGIVHSSEVASIPYREVCLPMRFSEDKCLIEKNRYPCAPKLYVDIGVTIFRHRF